MELTDGHPITLEVITRLKTKTDGAPTLPKEIERVIYDSSCVLIKVRMCL